MLTNIEIEAARDNISLKRTDVGINIFTSNNTVIPLIDAEIFFSQLYEDISLTQHGDFIHGTFFEGNIDLELIEKNKTATLFNVLSDALKRGYI